MKKLNKREILIFAVCLAVVLMYVIYNFVILPMNERGSDISDQVMAAEKKLKKNRIIIQSGAGIDQQYQRLTKQLGVSTSKGAEFSQIISKLEGLAREANIHVANIQPQQALTKEVVRIYPVEIDIDGSWPSVAKFLYLVQAQPNFFNVDELNLERFSENVATLRGRMVLSRVRVGSN